MTINDADKAESANFSGTINGTGDVLKTGNSTQVFAGVNNGTGTLFVKGGKVVNMGAAAFKTIVVGGDPVTLINDGTFTGQTFVNAGGLARGTGHYGPVNVNADGALSPGDSGARNPLCRRQLHAGGRRTPRPSRSEVPAPAPAFRN